MRPPRGKNAAAAWLHGEGCRGLGRETSGAASPSSTRSRAKPSGTLAGAQGARPALAVTGSGAVAAWFEGSRVKIARLTRDGLETASVLARVSGYQPYPAIASGPEPGQWYISWRDYESGHLEAFVVRAGCQ